MKLTSTLLIVALFISLSACKKDQYNYDDEDVPEVPGIEETTNKPKMEALIDDVYRLLPGHFSETYDAVNSPVSNWSFGDVTSDDAYKGGGSTSEQADIHKMEIFNADATSLDAKSKWLACYQGITTINDLINQVNASKDFTDAERMERVAELRFLRGHFYFELKKIFNRIPWIDEKSDGKKPFEVSNDLLSSEQVWAKIEGDFKAAQILAARQTELKRPTKYAAWAYLCKAYIFQKKWAEARAAADMVINSGSYDLMPNFGDVFLPETENGKEVIFSVQHDIKDPGLGAFAGAIGDRLLTVGGGFWPGENHGFLRPSQNLVNFYKTDSDGWPTRTNVDIKPEDYVDPRLDFTVARPGIPFHDLPQVYQASWARNAATYGPFSMKKRIASPTSGHWLKVAPYTSDLNYCVIRYADVLLWKAEAAIETGDWETGRHLINSIRNRAKNSAKVLTLEGRDAADYRINDYPWAFSCYDCAMEALKDERRLEFALEGHRFFDLVRWGDASTTMNIYFKDERQKCAFLAGAIFTKNRNEYQPIPQSEIALSKGVLKQNPGY